jgi:glycosyltransferase involved in cell wall biosynthesis
MRVLHIIDSLGAGGAERVVKNLLEYQQDKDLFLYAGRSVDHPLSIAHPNVMVHRSSSRFSLGPLQELRTWIHGHPVDVLHCHLFRAQVFGWLLKALYFPSIALVFHEHGRVFGSELNSIVEDRFYLAFLRIASTRVDRFIAISRATRSRLMSRAGIKAEKITTLYNFVDPEFCQPGRPSGRRLASRLQGPEGASSPFHVGFAGRLVPRKGVSTFLAAADLIAGQASGFKFLIAGDGPERESVQEKIRTGVLSGSVSYLGHVREIASFYNDLDCLVVPSTWEPQGLVEIEAQTLGVPVIVSNTEALNEIIQDGRNGLLFETGNAADLAAKIQMLQSQAGLCHRLMEGGLQTARQYDIGRYVAQLETLYGDVVPVTS